VGSAYLIINAGPRPVVRGSDSFTSSRRICELIPCRSLTSRWFSSWSIWSAS